MNDHTYDGYFFMHIPKTAGSTFNSYLEEIFKEPHLYPNLTEKRNRKLRPYARRGPLLKLGPKRKEEIQLVRGHLNHKSGSIIFDNPFIMTFLREPVDRILSVIRHHKFKKRVTTKGFEPDSFKEAYLSNQKRLVNSQIRYFLNSKNDQKLARRHVNIALSVAEQMNFIGLTERFDDSIELLCASSDRFTPLKVEKRNVNQTKLDVPKELIDMITEDHRIEILFYNKVKELVEKRLEAL